MKFKYKNLGNKIIRPIIPIKIISGEKSIETEALIDSGADVNLFDASFGEALGIQVRLGKYSVIMGIEGNLTPYYIHNIKINVGGNEYITPVGFMPRYNAPHSLLGQTGFFNLFTIKFDYLKKQIELKEK